MLFPRTPLVDVGPHSPVRDLIGGRSQLLLLAHSFSGALRRFLLALGLAVWLVRLGLLEGEIEETAPSALHHPSSIWTQPPLTFALSHSLVRHPFILLLCAALLLLFSSGLRVSNPNCSPLPSLSQERLQETSPALPNLGRGWVSCAPDGGEAGPGGYRSWVWPGQGLGWGWGGCSRYSC